MPKLLLLLFLLYAICTSVLNSRIGVAEQQTKPPTKARCRSNQNIVQQNKRKTNYVHT